MLTWKIGLLSVSLLAALLLAAPLGLAQPAATPAPAAAPSSSSTEAAPATATPAAPEPGVVHCGPLEITPLRAGLILKRGEPSSSHTMLYPMIRFQVKNTSASDVKIILFASSVGASDASGQKIFPDHFDRIVSYGIPSSKQRLDDLEKAFTEEKSKFVSLAPQQSFEAQISVADNHGRYLEDRDHEFLKSFRPKTITFAATVGIINLDGSTEKRAFSFSHLPIQITVR